MNSLSRMLASAAFATVLVASPAMAQDSEDDGTTAVVGGQTDVTLTAAPTLADLGLSAAPTGTATVTFDGAIPTFSFPITGGMVGDDGTMLNHDGSGILFTGGDASLGIGNFMIDTSTSLVSGLATANGTELGIVPIFSLGTDFSLALTADAAGAFTTVFGAPNLTGTVVGFANPQPALAGGAVPEPGTWALMLLGFGFIGSAIRAGKRRKVTVSYA